MFKFSYSQNRLVSNSLKQEMGNQDLRLDIYIHMQVDYTIFDSQEDESNSKAIITLFSRLDQFHDPRICLLYFVAPLNKIRVFINFSYIQAGILEVWVELFLGTIHRNQCSSLYYSQEHYSLWYYSQYSYYSY